MEKLNIITAEMAEKNIEMLGQMFPNCLTEKKNEEGKTVKAIYFDKLRQELADSVVEGPEERYQFTWPDKRNAIRLANAPTTKTLRPCREESVDFDNTQNLYIEGDNLDVLKILRENYLGKVKMIYIDPPYNTGNDFVYNDDFSQTSSEYVADSGQFDSEGNRLVLNTESNGRFHTDWLNMMYPRLKVAKDLLTDDGVIFISIDDNEVNNLREICDEIFGGEKFVSQFIWKSRQNKDNRNISGVSIDHEYILCYTKTSGIRAVKGSERKIDQYSNPDNDPRGPWTSANMAGLLSEDLRPNCHYDLVNPVTGINYGRPKMGWRYDRVTMSRLIEEKRIIWPTTPDGRPRRKAFLYELKDTLPGYSSLVGEEVYTRVATQEVESLFSDRYFDFPKPVQLIRDFIDQAANKDSIIVDFFSGSATTAHAVMQLNADDGGQRKFILVQLPENTEEKSKAYKAGYKNICEIGKERIRRAGRKILTEVLSGRGCLDGTGYGVGIDNYDEYVKATGDRVLDIGFRVLKLDSANEKEVKRSPSEVPMEQGLFDAMLDDMVENIKEDRTPEDLLFQVLPMCNLPLSCKIETKEIDGKCVFIVEEGYLIACFDNNINETVITEIAKMQPYYFVMRDSSLATDNVADNFDQIFNAYSKDTIRRIL